MRQLFVATVAAVALLAAFSQQAQAGKVEIKGVHLCCPQCVKGVGDVLGKVDGVSDAKCDRPTKTVTFTSKNAEATEKALQGLCAAGFYGTATDDGKEVKVTLKTPKAGDKADDVTVKDVHLCCNQCKNQAKDLFKDAKVEFPGKNEMKISGKDLDKAKVLETLRKAGFNGKIE